jgi:hypothetical protein
MDFVRHKRCEGPCEETSKKGSQPNLESLCKARLA